MTSCGEAATCDSSIRGPNRVSTSPGRGHASTWTTLLAHPPDFFFAGHDSHPPLRRNTGKSILLRCTTQNLACINCHDDNWDKRLEWQSLGSLQRRLRACLSGIRAQPYDYGAPELVELELYLMSRARDMPIETPAVRP